VVVEVGDSGTGEGDEFLSFWNKRNKYGNNRKAKTADGERVDSSGEAKRYLVLLQDEKDGRIRQLHRQVPYKLYGRGGNVICTLKVDFTYFEGQTGVAEDYKGMETKDFLIKEKLFKDNYPGVEFRKSGPWQKIRDKKNAKARSKRQADKMLGLMTGK
jgi:hypothetical protein